MFSFLYIFFILLAFARCVYYNSYYGVTLTEEQVLKYQAMGNLEQCTNNIELPCDPDGWRRLDGSCNNLNLPIFGTPHTPTIRVLEPVYGPNLTDRLSESGYKLPNVRKLRSTILKQGTAEDPKFTQLLSYFELYMFSDIAPATDTLNYILYTTYCCEPWAKGNYECTPQKIPKDDPVHRFSFVRCMNQTRPITFQTYGCLPNGTTIPARLNLDTLLLDQSSIYFPQGVASDRTYQGGELVVEQINGKIWPSLNRSPINTCASNQGPQEDFCFKSTSNIVLGGQILGIWFTRYHNYLARQLAGYNPSWDDERLFQTARDILIATFVQIYMYELNSELLGLENLMREGILSRSSGFRDPYDSTILPQLSEEFIYGLRYFHNIQETRIKMYDSKGYYSRTFPMVNLTLRPGFLFNNNHFDEITQSSFRQAGAKPDNIIDFDMSEVGLGPLQFSSDITMNDLAKGRQLGFQGYVKYREYCSGKKVETFEDLLDVMDQDDVDLLRESYEALGDIDLMAGIWSERLIPEGQVPHTVYCLFVEQLRRYIKSERFWYEREDRPHAFTRVQLHEIRKASMAAVLCAVGDSVTQIQKRAFIRIGPTNPIVDCRDIPMIDFSRWEDTPENNKNNPLMNVTSLLDLLNV